MIIKSMHIERFGILSGQSTESLSPGLNIFLGHNEAGKSTLLNFFRAMFFGYKRKNKIRFDHANSKNAAAGGELRLLSGRGRLLNVTRRPGAHGGELSVFDEQGNVLPPDIWSGLLSGVTAELYDNVFAFDLEDVSSLAGMNEAQVASALHGAAFGTGFKSPAQVLKTLEAAQQELFAPSHASKKKVNLLLQRLQEVKRALDESGSDIERHAALSTEHREILDGLKESEERVRSLNFSLSRLQSLQQALGLWQELRRLEGELQIRACPTGRFAPDSLARLENLCGEREARQTALEARGLELRNLRQLLAEERPGAALYAFWPGLRALQGKRAALGRILESLPGLELECRDLQESQERLLSGLGAGWTGEKALAAGLSVAMRDRLAAFQQRLDEGRVALEYDRKNCQNLERQYDSALTDEARLRQARGQRSAGSGSAGLSSGDSVPSAGQAANYDYALPETLFGPEMRLLLEETGQRLEHSLLAAREAANGCRALEREYGELEREIQDLRDASAALAAAVPAPDVLDVRSRELGVLRQLAEQALEQGEAAAALRDSLAGHKPGLFSFTPLSKDRRRLAPALLCGVLGALALYPLAGMWRSDVDFPTLSTSGWPSVCLGILALWLAIFWVSPSAAFLGLVKPRLTPLESRLSEAEERLRLLASRCGDCASQVNLWLPRGFSAVHGGVDLRSLSIREMLRAADNLEPVLAGWRREQARLRLLMEQTQQGDRKLSGLALRLEESRRAAAEAMRNTENCRQAWAGALRPYNLETALGATGQEDGCSPDTALQIFDRAARCSALSSELRLAHRRQEGSRAALEEVRSEWAAWLASAGFGEALAPAAVLEALALLEKYRDRHALLERKKREAESMRAEVRAFRDALAGLARQLSESGSPVPDVASLRARELAEAFDGWFVAAEGAARQEDLLVERQKDLLALEGRLAEAEASLRQCEQALEELFQLAEILPSLPPGPDPEPEGLADMRNSPACPIHPVSAHQTNQIEQTGQTGQTNPSRSARSVLERAEEFRLRHDEYRTWHDLQQKLARARLQLERHAAVARPRHLPGVGRGDSASPAQSGTGRDPEALWQDFDEFSAALENASAVSWKSASVASLGSSASAATRSAEERFGLCSGERTGASEDSSGVFGYNGEASAGEAHWGDFTELPAQITSLQADLDAVTDNMRQNHTRLGEIRAQLEDLERGTGSLALRQQEAGLREELETLARRWTVLGLARSFILRAKRSFEEERQDLVVRKAGDFFRDLTAGAYLGLNFDLEGGGAVGKGARDRQGLRALALPRIGSPLDSAESLSRGTREQLYLALRLAYISQHNQTRESLPLIMDDILVNFDPERTTRAAQVLERFSAGNQILFFTCHPHLAALLASTVKASTTFNITGGVIS